MDRAEIEKLILEKTSASGIQAWEELATLWSGYGHIWRVRLDGCEVPSIVVKQVQPPKRHQQPRGWNTNQSHLRKLESYRVESQWYRSWNQQLLDMEVPRTARCIAVADHDDEFVFLLEDLDASGYMQRRSSLEPAVAELVLHWLAVFHAKFLNCHPEGLWQVGSYWHLATRPDEYAAMIDGSSLKDAAQQLDQTLNECRFRTIIHGDAKVANFCFSPDGRSVAAVDFQYVGGGCGMKDVAYFLGSCMTEQELETHGQSLVDYYFEILKKYVKQSASVPELEKEWRLLYPYAWADFERFLAGWCPDHHKLHGYTRRMTSLALRSL